MLTQKSAAKCLNMSRFEKQNDSLTTAHPAYFQVFEIPEGLLEFDKVMWVSIHIVALDSQTESFPIQGHRE